MWQHSDPYTYKNGYWTITATNDNGILRWAIYRDNILVATRKNLLNAKDYAEQRQEV